MKNSRILLGFFTIIGVTSSVWGVLITDPHTVFSEPNENKPNYLSSQQDPTFSTLRIRVSNNPGQSLTTQNTGNGVWSSDARHNYSINQPWNSDMSLIAIENKTARGGSPSYLFLDGTTYAVRMGPPSNFRSDYDVRWHPSVAHPNEMIMAGSNATRLVWFDVIQNRETRSWTLPFSVNYIGGTKGEPSNNGRYISLNSDQRGFVVDMDPQPPYAPYPSRRIGPAYDFAAENNGLPMDNTSVSPSGKYLIVHYDGDYLRVFDIDPVTLALSPRTLPESSPRCTGTGAQGFIYDLGHSDIALNPFDNNEDVVIGQEHCGQVGRNVSGVQTVNSNGIGHIVMVRLRDGAVRSLTDPLNEAYAHHISARNLNRPGWVYVSYFPQSGKRFNDEVVALRMDGSQSVNRLAHLHSDFESSTGGGCSAIQSDFDYRSESHGVPSPDGLQVLFASNWKINGNGGCSIQDYLLDLRPSLQGGGNPLPQILLTKNVDKSQANSGDVLVYTITYQNTGSASAQNIIINDVVSPEMELVSGSVSNNGTFDANSNTLIWDIGTLSVGGSGQVRFQGRVK